MALPQLDWTGVGFLVGVIVWLVRIEGRVNYVEKNAAETRSQLVTLDSELVKKLASIETSVARIEGYLTAMKEGLGD